MRRNAALLCYYVHKNFGQQVTNDGECTDRDSEGKGDEERETERKKRKEEQMEDRGEKMMKLSERSFEGHKARRRWKCQRRKIRIPKYQVLVRRERRICRHAETEREISEVYPCRQGEGGSLLTAITLDGRRGGSCSGGRHLTALAAECAYSSCGEKWP